MPGIKGDLIVVFTQNMSEGMKEAKRKSDERILQEHKTEEDVRQKLKEDADKKKGQAILKNAAKVKKNFEENDKILEQEEKA